MYNGGTLILSRSWKPLYSPHLQLPQRPIFLSILAHHSRQSLFTTSHLKSYILYCSIPLMEKEEASQFICCRTYFLEDQCLPEAESKVLQYKNYIYPYDLEREYQLKKAICGMLNTEGGIILIGINETKEKKRMVVKSVYNEDTKENILKYFRMLAQGLKPNHIILKQLIEIEFVPIKSSGKSEQFIKGTYLIRIKIQRGERKDIYFFSENNQDHYYIRTKNQTIRIKTEDIFQELKSRIENPASKKPQSELHQGPCKLPHPGQPQYTKPTMKQMFPVTFEKIPPKNAQPGTNSKITTNQKIAPNPSKLNPGAKSHGPDIVPNQPSKIYQAPTSKIVPTKSSNMKPSSESKKENDKKEVENSKNENTGKGNDKTSKSKIKDEEDQKIQDEEDLIFVLINSSTEDLKFLIEEGAECELAASKTVPIVILKFTSPKDAVNLKSLFEVYKNRQNQKALLLGATNRLFFSPDLDDKRWQSIKSFFEKYFKKGPKLKDKQKYVEMPDRQSSAEAFMMLSQEGIRPRFNRFKS